MDEQKCENKLEQEQMRIFRKKTESATKTDQHIIVIMKGLEMACERKQPVLICELSRELADEVDHAFTHPELWGEERVTEVTLLLEKAEDATAGTPYKDNCAARPQEFKERLESLLQARTATLELLKNKR